MLHLGYTQGGIWPYVLHLGYTMGEGHSAQTASPPWVRDTLRRQLAHHGEKSVPWAAWWACTPWWVWGGGGTSWYMHPCGTGGHTTPCIHHCTPPWVHHPLLSVCAASPAHAEVSGENSLGSKKRKPLGERRIASQEPQECDSYARNSAHCYSVSPG